MKKKFLKFFFRAEPEGGEFRETFEWIHLLKKMFQSDFCIFDSEGILLASTRSERRRHILDLFDDTAKAQELLTQMETGQNNPGFWINEKNQKRFLFRLD